MEIFGKLILLAAIPVTVFLFVDLWQFTMSETLASASSFSQHWYDLMVDFWLASVAGVAFYPYLGNRFFCLLRAFMELLAKWFSKTSLKANDKCIGCGE